MKQWLGDLTTEVCERLEQDLEENERRATLLTVSFHYYQDRVEISQSRSCPLNTYKQEKVAASCFNIITKSMQHPISFIGLSAGKFIAAKGSDLFRNFFKTNTNKKENEVNSSKPHEEKNTLNTSVELESNQEIDSILNAENDCRTDENDCGTEENYCAKESDKKKDKKENDKKEKDCKTKSDGKKENDCKTNENRASKNSPKNPKNSPKNRKNSRDSFDRALNSDNFKQSFFMNILKKKQNTEDEMPISKNHPQVDEENQNKISDNINEFVIDSNGTKSKTNLNDSENLKAPSNLEISSKSSNFNQEKEEDMPKCSPLYSQVSNINWSAAKMDNVEPFVNNKGNVTVKLQEIFPDLSDIDPGVISLLPQELQNEASELLKNITKTNKKAEIIAKHIKMKKVNKAKCQESGSSKSENTIHNFLIKSSTSSETDDSLKKCDKCHQLVSIEKMIEHNDYHIAHELQREMDKVNNVSVTQNNNCMKRKHNFDSNVEHSKKRVSKNLKNSTKSKSIASYFS